MNRLTKILLSILLDEKLDKLSLTKEEWKDLHRFSKENDLHCVVFDRMEAYWKEEFKQSSLYTMWRESYLKEVFIQQVCLAKGHVLLNRLLEEGLEPVSLKGITLQRYYKNPKTRLMSDYDLLLPKEDIIKATTIFKDEGYKVIERSVNDITFSKPDSIPFEVHFELFTPIHISNGNQFTVAAYNSRIKSEPAYEFCVEENLSFLLGHSIKHMYYMGIGIKSIYDLYLYIKANKESINQDLLCHYLEQLSCYKAGLYLMELCNRYMDLGFKLDYEFDDYYIEELMLKVISSGNNGQSEQSVLLKLYSKYKEKGSKFGLERLKILFPYYWFHRLVIRVIKEKRQFRKTFSLKALESKLIRQKLLFEFLMDVTTLREG